MTDYETAEWEKLTQDEKIEALLYLIHKITIVLDSIIDKLEPIEL